MVTRKTLEKMLRRANNAMIKMATHDDVWPVGSYYGKLAEKKLLKKLLKFYS